MGYNYPEQLFADKGVMAIEHADFDGIERLALVTGGEIVSTFGNPEMVKIGKCDLIEQVQIGDETLLKFSGVPLGEACSVVLRGATEQIIGEAERSLHDALCVLTSTVKEPRTVYGGGYDSAQLVSEMKAMHAMGKSTVGLNMYEGKTGGMTESFSVKRQVLVQAAEAAEMILRVDDILKAAPRPRKEDRGHC